MFQRIQLIDGEIIATKPPGTVTPKWWFGKRFPAKNDFKFRFRNYSNLPGFIGLHFEKGS